MILIKINNIDVPVLKDSNKNETTFIIKKEESIKPEEIFQEYIGQTKQTVMDLLNFKLFVHSMEEASIKWCRENFSSLSSSLTDEQFKIAAIDIYREKFNL